MPILSLQTAVKAVTINKQTLRTRALTALIFVLVMFAGLFVNQWSFIALFSLILLGCLYEFAKILKLINARKYALYLPLAIFYIILPIMLIIDMGINADYYTHFEIVSRSSSNYSALLPCAIIFSLWVNDTMAYLVGSMIGKTPFSAISPKKTWEGTIGGAILCMLSMSLLAPLFTAGKLLTRIDWIAIAALCALFGTLGDLLESKLKRLADIKDSGKIMPGHGGFLDRFDSLLVATPFVWVYIKLFI